MMFPALIVKPDGLRAVFRDKPVKNLFLLDASFYKSGEIFFGNMREQLDVTDIQRSQQN